MAGCPRDSGEGRLRASAAALSWQESPDEYVQSGGHYQVEYRRTSAPADASYLVAGSAPLTAQRIFDVAPGLYSFRVQAINQLGVRSAYSTTGKEVFGLSAPPSPPTGVTISTIGGLAGIRWAHPPELDVKIGGHIVFRHSQLAAGATWSDATGIGDAVPAIDT